NERRWLRISRRCAAFILSEKQQAVAASNHEVFRGVPGEPGPRLEMLPIPIERLPRLSARSGIKQASLETESLHLGGDWAGDVEIEASHHAIVTLGERSLVVVPEPEIQSQLRRYLPVILNEASVIVTSVCGVNVISNLAAVRVAEQK